MKNYFCDEIMKSVRDLRVLVNRINFRPDITTEMHSYLTKIEAGCTAIESGTPRPIDIILQCPNCHEIHIDRDKPEQGWKNIPHRTHQCDYCGTKWRPCDFCTNGVGKINTKGKDPEFEFKTIGNFIVLSKEDSDYYDNATGIDRIRFILGIYEKNRSEFKPGDDVVITKHSGGEEIHRFVYPGAKKDEDSLKEVIGLMENCKMNNDSLNFPDPVIRRMNAYLIQSISILATELEQMKIGQRKLC